MATMRDVAKMANVSVATVSAVVNKDSKVNVSDELTKRVEVAIKELNYRPNKIARALSKNQTNTLAYVVPAIDNRFFSQVAKKIESLAFEKDYSVYLCNTDSRFDRVELYTKNLLENKVDGIITTLTWEITESNFIESIRSEKIPIIGLAGARIINEIDSITINDIAGGKKATRHLIKRGYRNIGFIGIKESKTTQKRIEGFKSALQEAGLEFKSEYIQLGNSFSRQEGFKLTGELVKDNPNLNAIFVYNDVMAAGAIDKLDELGLRIPTDIAVLGFDNSISKYTQPNLTTMALDKERMAMLALDILFKRIEGNDNRVEHIEITPELVKREST